VGLLSELHTNATLGRQIKRKASYATRIGKLVPVFKHHAMKRYCGVEVYLHTFLTLALDGVSCQLHAPAALSSVK